MQPNTNLVLFDKVKMIDDIDPALLDEKLNKVQFLKTAVISESYKEIINRKRVHRDQEVTVIPKGFTYIDRDIYLDSDATTRYEKAKLFVTGFVSFDSNVTAKDIENHITEIKTENAIYCKTELKSAVLQKCDPSTEVISYSGNLRIVDGEYTLMKAELDYTENKISFVVHGVLEIHKDVDPQLLFDKVERIDLYGVVSGNGEQCGVLQTKLRTNNGVVSNTDEEVEENESENKDALDNNDSTFSNVAHLKL